MITGTAVGRLSRTPRIVATEGRSRFLSLTIVSSKEWGGKKYEQFCDINIYGKAVNEMANLTEGTLLVASGEISIRKSKDGKYTNLQLMGQVQVIDAPAPSTSTRSTPSTQSTTKPKPAEDPGEDDGVPF